MTVQIALLRAINVGGNRMVSMADLRALLTGLGFQDVRSLLQSGNLVFRSKSKTGASLEHFLEAELAKKTGLQTDFLVRSTEEWKTVITRNPFPDEARRDPAHLLVVLLKREPTGQGVEDLRAAIVGPETIQADGRQLYAVYPAGVGESKLTNKLIEKKLGSPGTGRNWNTVLKLAALAEEL